MRNIIGSPVIDDDFFGRDNELKSAWRLLENGNHLLISAPRRVGKTSFARHIESDAIKKGWKSLYIDVEDKDSETGFIESFVEALKEKESWFDKTKNQFVEKATDIIKSIEIELESEDVGSLTVKWGDNKKANKIKDSVKTLIKSIGKSVIIIDELPVLLTRISKKENGEERVSDFLHWLRALRQISGVNVYWTFCGSIGLDTFAERFNLSKTINDLTAFHIGAFDEHTADQFLLKIGQDNRFSLSVEAREEIIRSVGWPLPYYLQMIFSKLVELKNGVNKTVVTNEDVQDAFRLASENSNLKTWIERLDEQLLVDDCFLSKVLLDNLCKSINGLKRNMLERELLKNGITPEKVKDKAAFLLKMLEKDGYILSNDKKYAFRSPLLRIYWYNSRVK